VQGVRNIRIRLNHMRTFTALAFTGTITARGRYSTTITHITGPPRQRRAEHPIHRSG
jgi:hypothetical protein